MKKYRSILFILSIMLAIVLSACASNKEQGVHKNQKSAQGKSDTKDNGGQSPASDATAGRNAGDGHGGQTKKNNVADMQYTPIAKKRLRKIGDVIPYKNDQGDEMNFTVKSVQFGKQYLGKQLGDMQKDSLDAAGVKYDEKGNILNDYSYVWMTLDVDALKKDVTWNPLQFIIVTIRDDLTLYQDIGPYLFYFDGVQETSDHDTDIYFKTFQKGVNTEISLGFYTQDSVLDKKLGYYMSEGTSPNDPGENDYVVQLN